MSLLTRFSMVIINKVWGTWLEWIYKWMNSYVLGVNKFRLHMTFYFKIRIIKISANFSTFNSVFVILECTRQHHSTSLLIKKIENIPLKILIHFSKKIYTLQINISGWIKLERSWISPLLLLILLLLFPFLFQRIMKKRHPVLNHHHHNHYFYSRQIFPA